MKCYYEELGISREADDAEIKSAYRKLALRYHPDKNLDCAEEAKEKFQLIQQAYEVLSDRNERDFYDRHRDQILRGRNSNYEENTLDVFEYFTTSCYKGFGDDEKGFYAVYREVFRKIAAEDAEFMDDPEEVKQIPSFGDSQSSYEDIVGPFYGYWQSYCTKKTYTWLSPYDITEMKDRRVLRAVEKEMKKIVQNAKRERNDEIRSLVSFVRKRDKRIHAYNRLLEERAAINRKKQEDNRREQLLRRQREIEELRQSSIHVKQNDGYEEQIKQLEQQYGGNTSDSESATESEGEDDDGDQELEAEEFMDLADEYFCVACSKAFKNQKAFDNHALSKKHKENEERLKLEMLEDEEALANMNISAENENGEVESADEINSDDISAEEVSNKSFGKKSKKSKKNKKNISKVMNLSEDEDIDHVDINNGKIDQLDSEGSDKEIEKTNGRKSKKNKKSKKNTSKNIDTPEPVNEEETFDKNASKLDSDDDWDTSNNKKGNRKNQSKKSSKNVKAPTTPKPQDPQSDDKEAICSTDTKIHSCVTCKAVFDSKNKLFAHLKKTNHSVYIPQAAAAATKPEEVQKKPKGKRK